ncbi:hypothetical protein [Streptomyces sp. P17]|uniref:hypothetical protein n=1 Tax=Streptomyces sp. P17 TaxID=3074716 RepID=UPI0028F42AE0|nr:hypothetical protein [Streptomyces sp. P17]MDT9701697.1 hypothetical protein [Streptomyces sp. P17]
MDWISWTVTAWSLPKVPLGRSPPAPPVPVQVISHVIVAWRLKVPSPEERRLPGLVPRGVDAGRAYVDAERRQVRGPAAFSLAAVFVGVQEGHQGVETLIEEVVLGLVRLVVAVLDGLRKAEEEVQTVQP